MLSYIFEYNGYVINDKARLNKLLYNSYASLNEVSGFSGDELVHTVENPTDTHGIIDYPSFMQGRLVTLGGGVVGKTEEDCVAECNLMSQALAIPFAPENRLDGYNQLIFYHWKTPHIKYFINAKPHTLVRFSKRLHIHRLREFLIQLRAESPFIYEYEETVGLFNENNGEWDHSLGMTLGSPINPTFSFDLTNNGTYDTFLRMKVDGPFQSVKIVNETTGKFQEFAGVNCGVGEWISINSQNVYAYKNDDLSQPLYNSISLDSDWLSLKPGVNNIKLHFTSLTGVGGRPKVEVGYRGMFLVLP